MKKLAAVVLFLCVPQEAWVSQVHVEETPHDWEHSLEHAPVVVLARRSGSLELFREWIFPRETHYEKNQETGAEPTLIIRQIISRSIASPMATLYRVYLTKGYT